MTTIKDAATTLIVERINHLPDAERLQMKYELLCAIMEGESGNNSGAIYETLLADFAIALMNNGFNPRQVLLNLRARSQNMVDKKLREQGITFGAPKGDKPN